MKLNRFLAVTWTLSAAVNLACSASGNRSFTNLLTISTPLAVPTQTPATAPVDETIVDPGRSIGSIVLGHELDRVLELLPFKQNTDVLSESARFTGPGFDITCPREYHWISPAKEEAEGEFYLYFDHNKLFQIRTRSQRYRLDNGLGVGSRPEEVLRVFPNANKFKIDFGSTRRPGNEEVEYLVYQERGLAFQVTSESDGAYSEVTSIIVFSREREFVPQGCITPPATYVQER